MKINTSPKTLKDLKKTGYTVISAKEELRNNLITKIKNNETLFLGIVGYDETVIPQIQNAILSNHDFIFLGLRGQTKSKILRELINILDESIPVIEGCEINDNPYIPVCKRCHELHKELGDDLPVAWLSREQRYAEKLATPEVSIADLISGTSIP